MTWKVSNIATEVPLHSSNVIFDEGERHLGAGLSYDTDVDFLCQYNPGLETSVDGPVDHVFVTPEDSNTTKRKNQDMDQSEIVAKRPHLASRSTRSTSRETQQRSSIQGERLTCPVSDDTLSEFEPSVLDHVVESLVAQYTDKSTEEPQTPGEKLHKFQQKREAMFEAFALMALDSKVQFAYDLFLIMVLGSTKLKPMKQESYTALGNRQREYIDHDETVAPVVRSSSLKTLLAVTAARDLLVHQMDVDTAFLYGVMPPEPILYMEVSEGFFFF